MKLGKKIHKKNILSIILVFAIAFSALAVSAADMTTADYIVTITTESLSYSAGDTINVTVILDGPLANMASFQYDVNYDASLLKVDTEKKSGVQKCFDRDWYIEVIGNELMEIKPVGLGAITAPFASIVQIDSQNFLRVAYSTTNGNTVSGDSTDNQATAGKLIFTALNDISDISKAFSLENVKGTTTADGTLTEKTFKVVQIVSPDQIAAYDVVTKISNIGDVTEGSENAITEAESAYDKLTPAQKALVDNYNTLTTARKSYDTLKANKVIEAIRAIGTVSATDECNAKITNAEALFDALTDAQKKYVSNYSDLIKARADYNKAVSDKKDKDAADKVIALIDALGDVQLTTEYKSQLDKAQNAYDALENDNQKNLVTNKNKLDDKINEYNRLESEAKNKAKAAEVDEFIENIAVELSDKCAQDIAQAKIKYNALTETQKGYVNNLKMLTDKEDEYNKLVKDKEDNDAATNVNNLISDIDMVSLESKGKIDAARTAYEKLTDDQKKLISEETLKILTDAEAKYKELKDASDKEEADKAAAKGVDDLIGKIGNVEYTDDCKAKIDAAQSAFDSLEEDQKKWVSNKDVLDAAKAEYAELKKIADDKAYAKNVDDLISAIGTVTLDSEKAIKDAEDAFGKLTDTQKTYVTKEDDLKAARTEYEQLKKEAADKAYAKNVDDLISAIGTVTLDSEKAIKDAEDAYDKLTDTQKTYVTKEDVLKAARTEYDRLYLIANTPVVKPGDKTVYNGVNIFFVTNVKENEIVKIDGHEVVKLIIPNSKKSASGISYKEIYVLVTKDTVDYTKVTKESGTMKTYKFGNMNDDSEVTFLDALIANQKSADMSEVDGHFANPISYVLADIDGDGMITAYDARLISRIALNDTSIDWENIAKFAVE